MKISPRVWARLTEREKEELKARKVMMRHQAAQMNEFAYNSQLARVERRRKDARMYTLLYFSSQRVLAFLNGEYNRLVAIAERTQA